VCSFLSTTENLSAILRDMLSELRKAWSLTNLVLKFLTLAKGQPQRDLQQSYLMRAAMETEKLKALIEEIAKEVKK